MQYLDIKNQGVICLVLDYKQITGIKRFPMYLWDSKKFKKVGHKPYLDKKEVYELLTGLKYIRIDEKLDGRTGVEQIKNVAYGYSAWAFYEDISMRHTIQYKRNGPKKIIFDILYEAEGNRKFYDKMNEADEYMEVDSRRFVNYEWYYVPHSQNREDNLKWIDEFVTMMIPNLLKQPSNYGSRKREGIVIKNYQKNLFAKVINPEFEDEITENYIRRNRKGLY